MANQNITKIEPKNVYEIKYELRTALFGLMGWKEEISSKSIGTKVLTIETSEMPNEIIINVGGKIKLIKL